MGKRLQLRAALETVVDATAPPDWRNAELASINGDVVIHAGAGTLEGAWHRQDSDECLIVLDGELTVDFDDGPQTALPGDCILIAAFERHRVRAVARTVVVAIESHAAVRLPG